MSPRSEKTSTTQLLDSESDIASHIWSAICDLVLDNERRKEVSGASGLSFARIRALRRIAWEPRTMREIATMLGIDAPYATLVVDELERLHLVERRPHPTDRRAKVVHATEEGARLARQADEILARPPKGFANLSRTDLDRLSGIFEKVLTPAVEAGA